MNKKIILVIAAVLIEAVVGYLYARKYRTEREIHLFDCRMKEWKRQLEYRERM